MAKSGRSNTLGLMDCAIQKTLGFTQACAGAECPFWEIGDESTPEGCFVHRHFPADLTNREVAGWLVGLRRSLERIRIDEGRLS
jgi:hypothetical protein